MGRKLLAGVKALFTAILLCGAVVASFYLAYLVLILVALVVVGMIAYLFFSRETSDWFKYKDSD